jgi:hypothetical protein
MAEACAAASNGSKGLPSNLYPMIAFGFEALDRTAGGCARLALTTPPNFREHEL